MRSIGEVLLSALSQDPKAPEFRGYTLNTDLTNALSFLNKTVPGFAAMIRDQRVLDFGCGWGWQSVAMAQHGAREVVGVDIGSLDHGNALIEKLQLHDKVTLVSRLDPEMMGSFDVVISCCSFEHFSDPASILEQMRAAARPGGKVIVSFGEPWFSPHGSHMNFFTRLPWVNLLFPEKTVMKVRSRYRSDGAQRYEDVQGGLNRMTLRKFERIIRNTGMKIEFLRYYSTKGLPLVAKTPVLRELLVAGIACILTKS